MRRPDRIYDYDVWVSHDPSRKVRVRAADELDARAIGADRLRQPRFNVVARAVNREPLLGPTKHPWVDPPYWSRNPELRETFTYTEPSGREVFGTILSGKRKVYQFDPRARRGAREFLRKIRPLGNVAHAELVERQDAHGRVIPVVFVDLVRDDRVFKSMLTQQACKRCGFDADPDPWRGNPPRDAGGDIGRFEASISPQRWHWLDSLPEQRRKTILDNWYWWWVNTGRHRQVQQGELFAGAGEPHWLPRLNPPAGDRGLRQLERVWKDTGADDAGLKYMQALLRNGDRRRAMQVALTSPVLARTLFEFDGSYQNYRLLANTLDEFGVPPEWGQYRHPGRYEGNSAVTVAWHEAFGDGADEEYQSTWGDWIELHGVGPEAAGNMVEFYGHEGSPRSGPDGGHRPEGLENGLPVDWYRILTNHPAAIVSGGNQGFVSIQFYEDDVQARNDFELQQADFMEAEPDDEDW